MVLPPQKLSRAEKLIRHELKGKNNIEETVDFYIGSCNWNKQTQEILDLYKAVEGNLVHDYKTIQNPYNATKNGDTPLKYNATLQNHNILKGIVNLLMGEFGRRVHEYNVTTVNSSDTFAYKDGLNIVIKNYYAQHVANELDKLGVKLGQQVKELEPLESYVEKFKQTFEETRIISGQEILDYIVFACDLPSKYLDLYYDWVITGRFFTFKTVNHDNVYFEVVPVHEMFVPQEKHSRFVEDYTYHVRRQIMPMFKVVDFFRGRLPDDIIDDLEKQLTTGLVQNFANVSLTGRQGLIILPTEYTSDSSFKTINSINNGVEVFHVVYDTWRKYGVLKYNDPLIGETEMEVGEDHTLDKSNGDISIKWAWEKEKYQAFKVLDYYLDAGPLPANRADLDQEGLQKSPYNGTIERSINGDIQSIIKEGLPYQKSINVLHYQVQKLVNKNKDKLIVMPYGLIPTKQGIDASKQMYHADATGILWIDETAPNAQLAAQTIKTLDMSLGNYIAGAVELIKYIKSEYWEAIGMNPQRYANVGDNAGKGVTEQAIIQSAIITYELTRQFDKVIEKDYQGLLDISKLAYINGKKAKYVRGDASVAFLNMNIDAANYHSENSYNIFVQDASIMTEAIKNIRAQATNLVQNGGDTSVLGHLFSTNNVTKLTKILEKLEDNKRAYDEQLQKSQQDSNERVQQSVANVAEKDREVRYYEIDKSYEATIESATIRSQKDDGHNQPRPANDVEVSLANHKINNDNQEVALKEKTLALKEKDLHIKNNNK
jgi:hypothetical protein